MKAVVLQFIFITCSTIHYEVILVQRYCHTYHVGPIILCTSVMSPRNRLYFKV